MKNKQCNNIHNIAYSQLHALQNRKVDLALGSRLLIIPLLHNAAF